MFKRSIVFILALTFLGGSAVVDVAAQTPTANALRVKAKAEERAKGQSQTKVKLFSDATYVGIVSDVGDTSFTITDKGGGKHTVQYTEVKSIGGTGWGTGTKIGIGIAIGAGAVLGVLAAIVASDNQ
jgi:hypothetical protein